MSKTRFIGRIIGLLSPFWIPFFLFVALHRYGAPVAGNAMVLGAVVGAFIAKRIYNSKMRELEEVSDEEPT